MGEPCKGGTSERTNADAYAVRAAPAELLILLFVFTFISGFALIPPLGY